MKKNFILMALMLAMGLPVSWAQPSDWPKNPVIYEVNLRHHTAEGSIAAFRRELPKLKQLGVNVLWFMPVQPIGERNAKPKAISSWKTLAIRQRRSVISEVHTPSVTTPR